MATLTRTLPSFKDTAFLTSNISKMAHRDKVKSYYRTPIHNLLNGTTFNELDWPLTGISRSWYFSTLNISEMARDRAILLWEEGFWLFVGLPDWEWMRRLFRSAWPIRSYIWLAVSEKDDLVGPKPPSQVIGISAGRYISISCRVSVSGRNSISGSTYIPRPTLARDLVTMVEAGPASGRVQRASDQFPGALGRNPTRQIDQSDLLYGRNRIPCQLPTSSPNDYLLTYVKMEWKIVLQRIGLAVALENVALSQQLEFYLLFLQLLTGGAAKVQVLDPCSLALL